MAGAPSNQPRRKATSEEFIEMSKSEEFADLKTRFRGFTFPAIIIALLWFFAFLVGRWLQHWLSTRHPSICYDLRDYLDVCEIR